MHPVMQVKREIVNGKPQYELTLSRANFNHLCAGCPDFDRLVGYSAGGFYFCLFPNPLGGISDAFRPMPDREGYFTYVGAPVPRIPQGVTNKEFEKLSQQAYDTLERAINESNKIPIEEETGFGKINLGYVLMKVEKDSSIARLAIEYNVYSTPRTE